MPRKEANEDGTFATHYVNVDFLMLNALEKAHPEHKKGLKKWREKIRRIQDCEKANKDLTNLLDTSSSFMSHKDTWKELTTSMDANEIKWISKHHDDAIDRLKARKEERKNF